MYVKSCTTLVVFWWWIETLQGTRQTTGFICLKYDSAIACGLPLYLCSYKLVSSATLSACLRAVVIKAVHQWMAQRWTSEWRSRVFHRVRRTMTSPIWSRVSSRPWMPSYRRWTWSWSFMPTLTLDLWDISVVLVVMNRFDLWDALANMWTLICVLVLTFVELCIRWVKLCWAWCSSGPLVNC